MAIDQLARGLAASAQGGGGGVVDVNIKEGVGIHVETQGDDVTISNLGVTNITASDTDAEDGTVKVVFGADSSKNKNVPVKGLKAGAYKAVDTKVDATTKDSTNVPTTKAVYDSIKGKVDSSAVGDTIATLDSTKKLPTTQLPAHNHNASEVTAMTNYKIADEASAITQTDSLNAAIGKLEKAIEGKMPGGKNYAGASTDGGAATSAEKLTNTTAIGSTTKGVYFDANGLPKPMTYELNKTVPSNAEFTDTKYTADTNSGISVNADTKKISNTGVRSISESSNDGKIGFNLNGTDKEVQVKGFKDFILKKLDTPATSYAAQYQLFSRKDNTGEYTAVADSATIDIPKDLVVESGDVKTCTVANVPVSGYKVGDKYIDLVIANIDNKHIYIPVNALVDDKAEGISYSNATSKLTAKNVQAAIDEVVTKIGALDQSKLDKTAVLSEIPSSLSPDTVLSAQLSLDTFTKKVTTEAVTNNTRIITVPENTDCFAGIGMIGGKTQKCKNLSDIKPRTETDVAGVKSTIANNLVTASGTSTGNGDIVCYLANNFSLNNGEKVTISLQGTVACSNCTVFIYNQKTGSYPVYQKMENYTATLTAAGDYDITAILIRVPNAVAITGSFNVMIEKGTVATPYEPYRTDLWNAPVTAVESMGVNIIDEQFELGDIAYASGNNLDSTARIRTKNYIPVNGGSTIYVIRPNDICGNIFAYDKDKKYLGRYTGGLYEYNTYTNSITLLPNAAFIKMELGTVYGTKYKNDICLSYNEVPSYVPHIDKTTINLSDIYGNLEEVFPDYGASAVRSDGTIVMNELDLENGVYHHRVKKLNGSELKTGWDINSILGGVFWCSSPSDTVVTTGSRGIVCNLYNTSSGNYDQLGDGELFMNDAGFSGVKRIVFKNSKYPNTTDGLIALKSKINADAVFYYETSEPEEIPLSSILPPIHVEPNGTIEFVNEHNLDVPSKTIYKKTV